MTLGIKLLPVSYKPLSHRPSSDRSHGDGATIGAEGVMHAPPVSNVSVFTVLTPQLPMQ